MGVAVGLVLQPHQLERALSEALALLALATGEPERHVRLHRQVREQRVVLEDDPHPAVLRHHEAVGPGQLPAADGDPPCVRALEAGDEPEEGGLAAARRPEHGHQLAALDLEAHVLHGAHRSERLGHAAQHHVAHAGTASRSTSAQLPAACAASSSAPPRPGQPDHQRHRQQAHHHDQQRGEGGRLEQRLGGGLPYRHRERVAVERAQQERGRQLLHHLGEHEQRGGEQARCASAARARARAGRGGRRPARAPPRRGRAVSAAGSTRPPPRRARGSGRGRRRRVRSRFR